MIKLYMTKVGNHLHQTIYFFVITIPSTKVERPYKARSYNRKMKTKMNSIQES